MEVLFAFAAAAASIFALGISLRSAMLSARARSSMAQKLARATTSSDQLQLAAIELNSWAESFQRSVRAADRPALMQAPARQETFTSHRDGASVLPFETSTTWKLLVDLGVASGRRANQSKGPRSQDWFTQDQDLSIWELIGQWNSIDAAVEPHRARILSLKYGLASVDDWGSDDIIEPPKLERVQSKARRTNAAHLV